MIGGWSKNDIKVGGECAEKRRVLKSENDRPCQKLVAWFVDNIIHVELYWDRVRRMYQKHWNIFGAKESE